MPRNRPSTTAPVDRQRDATAAFDPEAWDAGFSDGIRGIPAQRSARDYVAGHDSGAVGLLTRQQADARRPRTSSDRDLRHHPPGDRTRRGWMWLRRLLLGR